MVTWYDYITSFRLNGNTVPFCVENESYLTQEYHVKQQTLPFCNKDRVRIITLYSFKYTISNYIVYSYALLTNSFAYLRQQFKGRKGRFLENMSRNQ